MKKTRSTRRWTAIVLALTLVAIGLTIYVVRSIDQAPRTDDAYVYADTINVAPEVNGRIVELPVADNQRVKKGDLLFRIDPQPFEETLAKAEASLKALDSEITHPALGGSAEVCRSGGTGQRGARPGCRPAGRRFAGAPGTVA